MPLKCCLLPFKEIMNREGKIIGHETCIKLGKDGLTCKSYLWYKTCKKHQELYGDK